MARRLHVAKRKGADAVTADDAIQPAVSGRPKARIELRETRIAGVIRWRYAIILIDWPGPDWLVIEPILWHHADQSRESALNTAIEVCGRFGFEYMTV